MESSTESENEKMVKVFWWPDMFHTLFGQMFEDEIIDVIQRLNDGLDLR